MTVSFTVMSLTVIPGPAMLELADTATIAGSNLGDPARFPQQINPTTTKTAIN